MEIECKPEMILMQSFLPGLIKLLSPYWKCIKEKEKEYQKEIDALTEESFKDPEGCYIF